MATRGTHGAYGWRHNNAPVQTAALAIVFLGTVAALYLRPFGARDWHVALAGAVAAWAIGPLGFADGLETIGDSANIVAFFLGLMLLAAGAESAPVSMHGRRSCCAPVPPSVGESPRSSHSGR